jgi:Fingers domain of DNA polymerase lambda
VKDLLQEGFLLNNVLHSQDEAAHALAEFTGIWGVGAKMAQEWVEKGHRHIGDIRHDDRIMCQLTVQARTGLKYHEDLTQKIPREVLSCLHSLLHVSLCDTVQQQTQDASEQQSNVLAL